MTEGVEVTVAGKRYEAAAAYIQAVLGSLRSLPAKHGGDPVEVTVEPDAGLDAEDLEALR
jgi:hypothetical protein